MQRALSIFEEMRIRKYPIHGATFASLINVCSDNVDRAMQLYQFCKSEYPQELDDLVYFSIINGNFVAYFFFFLFLIKLFILLI